MIPNPDSVVVKIFFFEMAFKKNMKANCESKKYRKIKYNRCEILEGNNPKSACRVDRNPRMTAPKKKVFGYFPQNKSLG